MKDIVIRSLTTALAAALCVCAFTACSAEDAVDEAVPPATSNTTTSAEPVVDSIAEVVTTVATESTVLDTQPVSEATPPLTEAEKEPEEIVVSDGYTLADTDIVNTDGTYTQTAFDINTIPNWCSDNASDPEMTEYFVSKDIVSNPSKIPYSEITLENAHKAFPFLGFIGYYPNYIEVLPTDDADTIAHKVYDNLVGNESTGWGLMWQYHNFTSEAEYNEYLAEQQAAKEEAERRGQEAEDFQDAVQRGEASIGEGQVTDENVDDILANLGRY